VLLTALLLAADDADEQGDLSTLGLSALDWSGNWRVGVLIEIAVLVLRHVRDRTSEP
jgi:hypothetical protein